MNFPIAILLFCTMCGLVDKIIGGRFGLAEEFDRGMTMMGSLSLTMAGIYCFAVMLGRALAAILQTVSLPFDPTILVSSVLAVDMGAYPIPSAPTRRRKFSPACCWRPPWAAPSPSRCPSLWEACRPRIPKR